MPITTPTRLKSTPRIGLTLGAIVAAGLVALAAACGGDDGGNGDGPADPTAGGPTATPLPTSEVQVSVNLTEYQVAPDQESIGAGAITFVAKNIGGTEHELVVVRTNFEPDALPTKENGSVEGGDEDVSVVGDTNPFPAEQERTLTLTLEPGSYVLLCDVVQEIEGEEPVIHYQKGMFAAFEVTGG